jgi:hypothetical protein
MPSLDVKEVQQKQTLPLRNKLVSVRYPLQEILSNSVGSPTAKRDTKIGLTAQPCIHRESHKYIIKI